MNKKPPKIKEIKKFMNHFENASKCFYLLLIKKDAEVQET